MKVLLIGSGGREHALAWKISQSKKLTKLFIAPGNAGTSEVGENIDISSDNHAEIKQFLIKNNIELVVVGPEDPLVKGLTDFISSDDQLKNIGVIGPKKSGALLEGSKEYAKEFMFRHKIPTAGYLSVNKSNIEEGFEFLKKIASPYVLKADGLAAGKGVLILDNIEEAKQELEKMLNGKFGKASEKVVLEEYLQGIEMSAFAITDGKSYLVLPEAKDYKRIGEGDTGLNTGGMGCVSPVPFANKDFLDKVEQRIIKPTVEGLKKDNIDYKGFLFFGLMNCQGEPKVIEYNVRMGDPETEVIIPRIKTDLLEILQATAIEKLDSVKIEISKEACVTVMLVSGGYPEDYEKGKVIYNLGKTEDCIVFHAGTKLTNGKVVTNGGRVISVSAIADNFTHALEKSYKNSDIIDFEGKYFRRDIGRDLQKLNTLP